METKIILFILAGVFVVLLSGFYILYRRINRLEAANLQLQRYLLVARQMDRPVAVPSTTEPQRAPATQPSQPPPQRAPMSNLNNVLPMVNTFMNMFQGSDTPEPEEIEDKAKEMMQEEKKRRGLEKEIEQELEELQSSEIKEGRVENEEKEEIVTDDDDDVVVETLTENISETKPIPVTAESTIKVA